MINYGKHSISTEDVESVKKTLKSNFLTQGPVVQRFEKKLSEYFNSKYTLEHMYQVEKCLKYSCKSSQLEKMTQ